MSGEVFRRSLSDRRAAVVGMGVTLAVLGFFVISVSAALEETITDLTAGMPEGLTAFIGGDSPGGYAVSELFELMAPLALVAFAVAGGAAAVAGEESRGTMALLAAHPVSRARLLGAKAAAVGVALLVVAALLLASVAGSAAVFDVGLAVGGVTAAVVHLLFLAALFGAIALLVGAATGRPDLAVGVAAALAAVSYLADAMLPLAGLDRWAELSPWFYYAGSTPLANGVDVGHLLLLGGMTALAVAAAFPSFARRDLRG